MGGVWTNGSDRNATDNFRTFDAHQVLARVAALPITTWNYKAEDSSIRHLGTTAQNFHAAFGLGDSEVAIGTLDADSVALAAIRALYEQNQALTTENVALRFEAEAQQAQLDELEARLSALEVGQAGDMGQPGPARSSGGLLPWTGGLLVAVAGVWTLGRDRLSELVRGGRR